MPAPREDWNFHERLEKTKGVVTEWIKESGWSVKTRANFDRALDHLKALPQPSWHKPYPASKLGNHTYVIRFKDISSAQLRVFGHFFSEHHVFVMTFSGYEKGDEYYPANYEEVADGYCKSCGTDFAASTLAFETYCERCTPSKPARG